MIVTSSHQILEWFVMQQMLTDPLGGPLAEKSIVAFPALHRPAGLDKLFCHPAANTWLSSPGGFTFLSLYF